MKKILLFYIALFNLNIISSQEIIHSKNEVLQDSKKITFKRSSYISKKKMREVINYIFDNVDSLKTNPEKHKLQKDYMLMLSQGPDINTTDTLHVEYKKDTILRYRIKDNLIFGDHDLLLSTKGIKKKVGKDRKTIYGGYNLFKNDSLYSIEKFNEDRKTIKGFNCYKIVITKKEKDRFVALGNTIYECYVTDQIKLPFHAVHNIGLFLPNMFPLYIHSSSEKFKGMSETYELIDY